VFFGLFFVCTVTDFSAAEIDWGMKFRMCVRLLSAMSFSYFGELWFAGSQCNWVPWLGQAFGIGGGSTA